MIQTILNFLKSRIFIAIICILLAAGVAFGLMPYLNEQTREVTTVVRAKETILENTPLGPDMFTTVEIGSYGLPSGVITDTSQLTGKYAAVDILPTDNITAGKLTDSAKLADSTLYTLVAQERVAVSVSVSTLASSVSGKLRAGDVVSVYAYIKTGDGKVTLYPELTYVEVAAVTNVKANNTDTYSEKGTLSSASGSDAVPSTVTLLVSQKQAKRLIEIENGGIAHIALVGRGEAAIKLMNEYVIPVEEDAQEVRTSVADAWMAWGLSESSISTDIEPVSEPEEVEGTPIPPESEG